VRHGRDEFILRAAERLRRAAARLLLLEQHRPVPVDFALRVVALAHPRFENGGCIAERRRQVVGLGDPRREGLCRLATRQRARG
jgi:hypothetical protein